MPSWGLTLIPIRRTRRRWLALHPLVLRRRGRVVDDEIHDPIGADVAQTGAEDYGEDFVFANSIVQRRNQVFFRDGSLFEKFFQQGVIALGHQFHQLFVLGLDFIFHVGGNLGFLSLAVSTEFIGVGLH